MSTVHNDTLDNYDVIIIGGGPVGLATAYHLSQRKAKTLVLEQYTFLNQMGSSAGVSRQYRIPYPDQYMVQMALDAQPYWDALQAHTPVQLLDKVGTLWFGDPSVQSTEGNIAEAESAMQALNVPYTALSKSQIEEQYHFKNLPENYTGLFQADGASIDLRATIKTLLDYNRLQSCVSLMEETPVIDIHQQGELFTVRTPSGTFAAKKLVIVPGPYVNQVIKYLHFRIEATYWNMSSCYFKKLEPTIQYPTWFVFQNAVGDNGNQFYGFPEVDWNYPGYVRVAPDFVQHPTDHPQQSFVPSQKDLAYTAEWVKNHMTGLDPTPRYTSTCMVALSTIPNKEMLIDFAPNYVPNHQNIVVYATGWAAKFIPLLGEILAEMAIDGKTKYDITPFQLGHLYFKSA
jgi:monomeric sarcosine oxidase